MPCSAVFWRNALAAACRSVKRQGESAGHVDQRPLALGRVEVGQHGRRLDGELRVVQRGDHRLLHAAQIVELARRAAQFGQQIEGLGRLPLPRLEADELLRRQRGQLIELPAERLVVVRPGERLGQRIELGETLGPVEIAAAGRSAPRGATPCAGRAATAARGIADHRAGRSSRRSGPIRSRAIARPGAAIPCRW